MTKSNDLDEALDPVVEAMDRLGVAYRIAGSVASAVLGVLATERRGDRWAARLVRGGWGR